MKPNVTRNVTESWAIQSTAYTQRTADILVLYTRINLAITYTQSKRNLGRRKNSAELLVPQAHSYTHSFPDKKQEKKKTQYEKPTQSNSYFFPPEMHTPL